ncbi:MAG TPA: alanine--glyoxylate aminotransferase family protein, partial [Bacteroidetes bacterium]|nr:alanine--glyoxylate aminotransferase family protein [Bacteroidota bacterium]
MKIRLFTPGPTPVPEKVMTRMADPILHHRTKEFSNIFTEVSEILKELFQTKEDVIILTSSGTGAMEAAVANHLNPGDEVLTIEGGKFGERWGELCEAYGVKAVRKAVPWG